MTDIVDRVRDIAIHAELTQVQQDVLHEAADTIERLRTRVENLTAVSGAAQLGPSFAEITKDLPRRSEFSSVTIWKNPETDGEPVTL